MTVPGPCSFGTVIALLFKEKERKSMIVTLSRYIKQYKKSALITIVLTIAEVVLELLIPYMMSFIIDRGVSKGDLSQVFKYGLFMVLLAVLGLFCGVAAGFASADASAGFAKNLREGMFRNIQRFSFSNIDKFSSAGLVTRLTTDITNVQNAFQMVLWLLMWAPATLIFAMIMTISISPRLSLIFFAAILFLGGILVAVMIIAMKDFTLVFEKYDELNASVQENISGIRVVKSYVQEGQEIGKFHRAIDKIYRLFVRAESSVVVTNPVMLLTAYGCITALSWFGARMIVAKELTTGELTSLFSYVMSILISLTVLSFVFVMIIMAQSSAERIYGVLAEQPDIISPENPVMTVAQGSVDFQDVSFSYKQGKGKPVLCGINLHFKPGETIGIIGGTGSSKTSLINLISRLYDVTSGAVLVGGINVKDYDLKTLRDSVSVVLQKNELFSGTILDNLRWGNEHATLEECQRACQLACADEFIEKMPKGYETWVERGGANLSGGQKQRLCIARALLKNPKILILDDSTSAVDTATDAKIRRAFREDLPGTTKIIISQRISSIKDADRIVVMDRGEVNGFGIHEELLKTNEIYAAVAEAQAEGNADFDKVGA